GLIELALPNGLYRALRPAGRKRDAPATAGGTPNYRSRLPTLRHLLGCGPGSDFGWGLSEFSPGVFVSFGVMRTPPGEIAAAGNPSPADRSCGARSRDRSG